MTGDRNRNIARVRKTFISLHAHTLSLLFLSHYSIDILNAHPINDDLINLSFVLIVGHQHNAHLLLHER
jgi:hypothetical protein